METKTFILDVINHLTALEKIHEKLNKQKIFAMRTFSLSFSFTLCAKILTDK